MSRTFSIRNLGVVIAFLAITIGWAVDRGMLVKQFNRYSDYEGLEGYYKFLSKGVVSPYSNDVSLFWGLEESYYLVQVVRCFSVYKKDPCQDEIIREDMILMAGFYLKKSECSSIENFYSRLGSSGIDIDLILEGDFQLSDEFKSFFDKALKTLPK